MGAVAVRARDNRGRHRCFHHYLHLVGLHTLGEVARRPHGLNLPVNQGKSFYAHAILVAAAMHIPPASAFVVLVVNVVAGLGRPALVLLYLLVNDPRIIRHLRGRPTYLHCELSCYYTAAASLLR